MHCERCFAPIREDYIFCKACGHRLRVMQTESSTNRGNAPSVQRSGFDGIRPSSSCAHNAPMSAPLAATLAATNTVLAVIPLFCTIAILAFASDYGAFIDLFYSLLFFLPMALLRTSSAVSYWLLFRGIKAGHPHSAALGGLTVLKVSKIISCAIWLTVVGAIAVIGTISTIIEIVDHHYYYHSYHSYYSYYSYQQDLVGISLSLLFIGLFVMALLYFLFTFRTVRSMRCSLQNGVYRRASIYVIVCHFMLATLFAVFLAPFFYLSKYAYMSPAFFLLLFALADCIVTALFLCSYNARRKRM